MTDVDMEVDSDLEFDLKIMALTVWAEARGEPEIGQRAVAWVIRNRFENPGWWSIANGAPNHTIAAVCLCPWQFSCWNDHDPNRPRLDDPATLLRADYLAIRRLCLDVLIASPSYDPTVGSDHYCTSNVVHKTPWARNRKPIAIIGHHQFFRIGKQGRMK